MWTSPAPTRSSSSIMLPAAASAIIQTHSQEARRRAADRHADWVQIAGTILDPVPS